MTMQSECRGARYLEALVDGRLPERIRAEMEKHLAACSSCRERRDALLQLSELARLGVEPGMNAAIVERAKATIFERARPERRGGITSPPLFTHIAAVAAGVLIAIAGFRLLGDEATGPQPTGARETSAPSGSQDTGSPALVETSPAPLRRLAPGEGLLPERRPEPHGIEPPGAIIPVDFRPEALAALEKRGLAADAREALAKFMADLDDEFNTGIAGTMSEEIRVEFSSSEGEVSMQLSVVVTSSSDRRFVVERVEAGSSEKTR